MRRCYVLALFTAAVALCACPPPAEAKFHVFIVNRVVGGENRTVDLKVHCRSNGGDDRGAHVLGHLDSVEWDVDKDTSTYTCDMCFQSTRGSFAVFNGKYASKCADDNFCHWRVLGEGLYLLVGADYELQYKWHKSSKS